MFSLMYTNDLIMHCLMKNKAKKFTVCIEKIQTYMYLNNLPIIIQDLSLPLLLSIDLK